MELIRLNRSNRSKEAIIPGITDLVWKERWDTHGEFVFKTPYIKETMRDLQAGDLVMLSKSDAVCVVKSFSYGYSEDSGLTELTVTGVELTDIFNYRVYPHSNSDSLSYTRMRPEAAALIVGDALVNQGLDPSGSTISWIDVVYDSGRDGYWGTIKHELEQGILQAHIDSITSGHNIGYFTQYNPQTRRVYIIFVFGRNNNNVIFDVNSGHFRDWTYTNDNSNFRHLYYGYLPPQGEGSGSWRWTRPYSGVPNHMVQHQFCSTNWEYGPTDVGFGIVLPITSSEKAGWINRAIARHRTAHRYKDFVTGSVSPTNPYVYRTHYMLGDVVRVRGPLGDVQSLQVSEYIYSKSQSEGVVEYPTLTNKQGDEFEEL